MKRQSKSASSNNRSPQSNDSSSAKTKGFFKAINSLAKMKESAEQSLSDQNRSHRRASLLLNETLFRARREIVDRYFNVPEVKKLSEYANVWLNLVKELEDPEEGFTYMYSYDIGVKDPEFFREWMTHYVRQHKFILAYQTFELCKETFAKNKTVGPRELTQLEEFLEQEEIAALVSDFYTKDYYTGNIVDERLNERLEDTSHGISQADFEEIQSIDLKKRINQVMAIVYGTSTSNNSEPMTTMLSSNAKKQKSTDWRSTQQREKEAAKKKKFSDLINTKSYNGLLIYIEKAYRAVIPKSKSLAYEYAFLSKIYVDQQQEVPVLPPSTGRPFWVKMENFRKIKELVAKRKIFRIKPKNNTKARSEKQKEKPKKESKSSNSNKIVSESEPPSVPARRPSFNPKLAHLQTHAFKSLDFRTEPTQESLAHISATSELDLEFLIADRMLDFPFLKPDADKRIRLIKPKSVVSKDAIIKELPRKIETESPLTHNK